MSIIWTKNPWELQEPNKKKLQAEKESSTLDPKMDAQWARNSPTVSSPYKS